MTAEEDPWSALRGQFHAEIRRRHLTRSKVADDLGVSKGSIVGWLLPNGNPPSVVNVNKIRGWLSPKPAPVTPSPASDADQAEPPPFVLSLEERTQLAGHISLTKAPELREIFGATRELLEQAASGAHLHADIIAKLRGVLASGAVAE